MNAVIYELPVKKNWQALYKAAIVEVDSAKNSLKVSRKRKR